MYARLLDEVLEERHAQGSSTTRGERLVEVLRCRSRLMGGAPSKGRSNAGAVALADQLAYDAALMELAQGAGVDFDIRRFDQPLLGRGFLEEALVSEGVPLKHPEEQIPPNAQGP